MLGSIEATRTVDSVHRGPPGRGRRPPRRATRSSSSPATRSTPDEIAQHDQRDARAGRSRSSSAATASASSSARCRRSSDAGRLPRRLPDPRRARPGRVAAAGDVERGPRSSATSRPTRRARSLGLARGRGHRGRLERGRHRRRHLATPTRQSLQDFLAVVGLDQPRARAAEPAAGAAARRRPHRDGACSSGSAAARSRSSPTCATAPSG